MTPYEQGKKAYKDYRANPDDERYISNPYWDDLDDLDENKFGQWEDGWWDAWKEE